MARLVTDYLDETVRRLPDKAAFSDERRSLSFAALQQEAKRTGAALAAYGWFRQPVALFFDKCVECIAAELGAIYSGNSFSPLDTAMPEKRIRKIMTVLEPVAVLTDRAHADTARAFAAGCPVLVYEEIQEQTAGSGAALRAAMERRIDRDVVSVLFTSGSTGVPKGVAVSHRFLVNYTEQHVETFRLDDSSIRANQVPLYFAIAAYTDVFSTLKTGCTTYLIPARMLMFPRKLLAWLAEKRVDTIFWVPSLLANVAMLGGLQADSLPPLKRVFFCGEPMLVKHLQAWQAAFPVTRFVNLYGSTEMGLSAFYEVPGSLSDMDVLPIGHASGNMELLLLDESGQPVPPGEVGEIYARGVVALGYYREAERTAAAFVQDPLQPGLRDIVFRTGDLARSNARGELVYVSRKDFQIKHMGYRIELGEVEAGISSIAGVSMCGCVYDTRQSEIVLFYVGEVEKRALLKAVADILPRYMWPTRVEHRQDLPHTLNGKIDRMALKEELLKKG